MKARGPIKKIVFDEHSTASEQSSDEDSDVSVDLDELEIEQPPILEAPENIYLPECSLKHVRVKEKETTPSPEFHHQAKYQNIYAEIRRTASDGRVKYQFDPAHIHHQLRVTLDKQANNQGNTIVVDLSFSIKATQPDGKEKHFTIHFPLDIPRYTRQNDISSTNADSYNFSNNKVSKDTAFALLKSLYKHGRKILNLGDEVKHGQTPKYDKSKGDEQFINHTEQTLIVYLCQPEAAAMIANRLVSSIRSQHTDLAFRSTIKIYHVGLHIHSNKTPCGPCELTLLGLQNTWTRNSHIMGFTQLLEAAFRAKNQDLENGLPNNYFKFTFPGNNKPEYKAEKKGIHMFTLYSGDGHDGTHKRHPVAKTAIEDEKDIPPTYIETKNHLAAKNLWTVNFGGKLPEQVLKNARTDSTHRTTFLSGSNTTPERKRTEVKLAAVNNRELDEVSVNFVDEQNTVKMR